ncbi:bifunctional 4-hydroxy-2-oxoglutarate aldolase/2-dehydro-3-deoxy-phosphogluconate aldolase [Tenuibacillus multivorans]|uniref:2-dehydro-3-deoxyphosphogluconate aldolase / (4S)-4-hydroxy-2-oxoglutarate aldolase n=1 Tax=Tenuibacillus multivorans TaxID=237069 RepID=A0A1H0AVX6_9BACI|nr:bifunctional 4-hydroxy-2-oxoglutarate aldolase/2-dehydro-3-deoxy-phosphogluconate aldolase [Tenuibacillus multivorans]GEL77793.1 2-dehydro-3-deoxy-phosphogluconate aldolase [Tenuibacillus multivorans]SDN37630.1 2-dehydro-3-deoxyphosphogluconate aldolase / (4S)-4-hydroxy-2-oxoglutarate aldolase [Tenuibacillus multivorans]
MKEDHLRKIKESGIVAVVRQIDPDKVHHVIDAIVEGGVAGIEVTVDSEQAFDVIREAKKRLGDRAVVGAGTVLDGHAAYRAIESGAEFIFAPTLKRETLEVANRYGKIAIPGVFTPTEILQAYEWGADIVKIFPASVLGPKFIKDVRGPLGHIDMMPTGGVNVDNVGEFIQAGACAAGIGGSLLKKDLIQQEEYEQLKTLAQDFVKQVKQARS